MNELCELVHFRWKDFWKDPNASVFVFSFSSNTIPLNVCPYPPLLIYNNLPPNWLIALPKSIYFLGNKSRISSESTGKLYLFVLLKKKQIVIS